MPLISHEVPRSLLKQSRAFNDYDYAFAHLYTDPDFLAFYKESVDLGRKVLLDNSAFELGAGIFDTFGDIVADLKPTWYVVPDVRHDGPATIASYERFIEKFPGLPGTAICAIQGDSFDALADCYKFMIEKTKKIAIPFARVPRKAVHYAILEGQPDAPVRHLCRKGIHVPGISPRRI